MHVSFATTYVNSQLQNYSDAKGGVQCNEVPCVIQMKQKVEAELQQSYKTLYLNEMQQ